MSNPLFFKLRPTPYALRSGFTLLELVVSIGIFLTLTLFILVSMRNGERNEQLRFAAEDLTQQIRVLQSYARTGKRFGTEVPKGGYGILFLPCASDPCILTVFADVNGNDRFDSGEALMDHVRFPSRVALVGVSDGVNALAGNPVLLARPPYGEFRMADANGIRLGATEARLTLTHQDLNRQKSLIINLVSGQIRQQ